MATKIININKATKEELITIREIGEARAKKIIAVRDNKGALTLEDLKQIEGVPSTLWDPLVAAGWIIFEDKETEEIDVNKQQLEALKTELLIAKQNVVTSEKEKSQLKDMVEQLTEQLDNLTQEKGDLESKSRFDNERLVELRTKFAEQTKENEDENDNLRGEIEKLLGFEKQCQMLTKEQQQKSIRLQEYVTEVTSLKHQLEDLNNALTLAQSDLIDREETITEQDRRIKNKEKELQEKENELQECQERIRTLEAELQIARTTRTVNEIAPGSRYSGRTDRGNYRGSTEDRSSTQDRDVSRSSRNTHTTTTVRPTSTQQPQVPRLAPFDGTMDWKAYYLQFEHTARRFEWNDDQKLDNLILCLRGKALKYFSTRPDTVRQNFNEVVEKMKSRFGQNDLPHSIRRQLYSAKQNVEETLDDFAERVQELATDGYSNLPEEMIEDMAVEAFLKGCIDVKAALAAMDKNPHKLDEALGYVRNSIYNQRLLLGSRKSEVRKVQFEDRLRVYTDTEDSDEEQYSGESIRKIGQKPVKPQQPSKLETQVAKNAENINKLNEKMDSLETNVSKVLNILSSNRNRSRSPSPARNRSPMREITCFSCSEKGHYANQCQKKSTLSPNKPLNGQGSGR